MSAIKFEPFDPEETIGRIWHELADAIASPNNEADGNWPQAAVCLNDISSQLAVFFRGLGGKPSIEIRATAQEITHERMSVRKKMAQMSPKTYQATFDGDVLRLPEKITWLPTKQANRQLYLWLVACAAAISDNNSSQVFSDDPLIKDLQSIFHANQATHMALAACDGMKPLYKNLTEVAIFLRPKHNLPACEAAVEELIRYALGAGKPTTKLAMKYCDAIAAGDFSEIYAPKKYKPYAPVPIWCQYRIRKTSAALNDDSDADTAGKPVEKAGNFRARRRKSEQAERRDSLILFKFEALLSWAEFLNINRKVEDDDTDNAKKAADDVDEIGLGQISKAPATKLKLHLDLAPEDVDFEKLASKTTYHEWDVRKANYLPDHCQVLETQAVPTLEPAEFTKSPQAQRRITAVKRQFEALRPARKIRPNEPDGDELDLDALVRSVIDIKATGEGSDRIWQWAVPQNRDLAVSILLDISRSTESAIGERSVIEVEQEALAALSWGLAACGDPFAINAFSSLKRARVMVTKCKDFSEPMSTEIEQRIAALKPGFYTRFGAAIRHVSKQLAVQDKQKRLLLIITDGKPNDLDHYEGRHGIEDTHMAIREARRSGQFVHGITIDAKGQQWFKRMFGAGHFSIVHNGDKLVTELSAIYRNLIGG